MFHFNLSLPLHCIAFLIGISSEQTNHVLMIWRLSATETEPIRTDQQENVSRKYRRVDKIKNWSFLTRRKFSSNLVN